MKILLLTVGTINYNCDINFCEPLKKIGFKVLRYNYLERLNLLGKEKMNQEVLSLAQREKPNYIFFITYQDQISEETLKKLREHGLKVVAWFSDDHWRFDNYSKFIARNIFCSITTDLESFYKYKKEGINVIKSQWAANPIYYHPVDAKKKHQITFVGQKYGIREKLVEFLKDNNVPMEAYGKGWSNYLPFEEIISLFSNSKINLNISASSKDEKIKQIKGRVFEVPMCGGFLLTDYVDGLEEYFKIGKEIVCYENQEDLLYKIKYYLNHDNERKKIALNGYKVSLKKHRWEVRFRKIFEELRGFSFSNSKNLSMVDRLLNLI